MFIQIASQVPFATDEEIQEALTLVPTEEVCCVMFYCISLSSCVLFSNMVLHLHWNSLSLFLLLFIKLAPQNVDLTKLRVLLLTEGERLTPQEFDALLRELLPPPPPEDPKKKKSSSSSSKGGKKKKEEEEEEPPPVLEKQRFLDLMPLKVMPEEERPVVTSSGKKK